MELTKFSDLVGQTLANVHVEQFETDRIVFTLDDGSVYQLHHKQDCCESVTIYDIAGEPINLIGAPILLADESSSEDGSDRPENYPLPFTGESETWTFYRIGTIKGSVVVRWVGQSNGYYSERVSFTKVKGC